MCLTVRVNRQTAIYIVDKNYLKRTLTENLRQKLIHARDISTSHSWSVAHHLRNVIPSHIRGAFNP